MHIGQPAQRIETDEPRQKDQNDKISVKGRNKEDCWGKVMVRQVWFTKGPE